MLNIIAIDASTEACSVALQWQGKIYHRFELCPQSHSTLLLPMIDEVLKEANCTLNQLDGLAFGRGPGSFTGVRIGIGVAQGLAFSADLKVVGISTLQAMAQQAFQEHQQDYVIAAIDARMSEIYLAAFSLKDGLMQPVTQETVIAPANAKTFLSEQTGFDYGVGSGWQAYQEALFDLVDNSSHIDVSFPDARMMLPIAESEFKQGNAVSAEQAQPVYVRDTVSWKKLPGRE